jgi:hypothetical protein
MSGKPEDTATAGTAQEGQADPLKEIADLQHQAEQASGLAPAEDTPAAKDEGAAKSGDAAPAATPTTRSRTASSGSGR